jgi:hypothetical protein
MMTSATRVDQRSISSAIASLNENDSVTERVIQLSQVIPNKIDEGVDLKNITPIVRPVTDKELQLAILIRQTFKVLQSQSNLDLLLLKKLPIQLLDANMPRGDKTFRDATVLHQEQEIEIYEQLTKDIERTPAPWIIYIDGEKQDLTHDSNSLLTGLQGMIKCLDIKNRQGRRLVESCFTQGMGGPDVCGLIQTIHCSEDMKYVCHEMNVENITPRMCTIIAKKTTSKEGTIVFEIEQNYPVGFQTSGVDGITLMNLSVQLKYRLEFQNAQDPNPKTTLEVVRLTSPTRGIFKTIAMVFQRWIDRGRNFFDQLAQYLLNWFSSIRRH